MLKILNIFISQTMLLSDDNFSKNKYIFSQTNLDDRHKFCKNNFQKAKSNLNPRSV